MASKDIDDFNSQFFGVAMIVRSGTKTHFMSADVWLQMLEQMISPALKLQRLKQLSGIPSDIFPIFTHAHTHNFPVSQCAEVWLWHERPRGQGGADCRCLDGQFLQERRRRYQEEPLTALAVTKDKLTNLGVNLFGLEQRCCRAWQEQVLREPQHDPSPEKPGRVELSRAAGGPDTRPVPVCFGQERHELHRPVRQLEETATFLARFTHHLVNAEVVWFGATSVTAEVMRAWISDQTGKWTSRSRATARSSQRR